MKMSSVPSFYDVAFRNLTEEHKYDSEKALSGKVSFVPAEFLYTVRREECNYHAEYEVFGSKDIIEIGQGLESLIKPKAHVQVFAQSYDLISLTRLLSSKKDKERQY